MNFHLKYYFFKRKCTENVICTILAILFRPQCVKVCGFDVLIAQVSSTCHQHKFCSPSSAFSHKSHISKPGTKPKLVAKFWPPTLVTFVHGLSKLAANVISQSYHFASTGLIVDSLVKWLPIKVAHTCKLDIIWGVYCSPIGTGSIRL